uniref:Uncharacterized protein n=1 Tax=Globodera rostochiensis TaxID=31243 RepID=A0A914HS06_GLORO
MASQEDLAKFTVVQLRVQLKKRNLAPSGLKADLIKRLLECPQAGGGVEGGNSGTVSSNEPVHFSRECPQAGGGVEGGNSGTVSSNEPVHFSRECPQAGGGVEGGNSGTVSSNEPVHFSRECPQAGGGVEGGNSGTVCTNCNEPGHFSHECLIGDGGNGEDSDIVCSNCFGSDHSAHHCPFTGGGGGQGVSHTGNVCSNCNEPGCFSRACLQGCGAVVGGVQMETRGRARAIRAASRQQSAALPRKTKTTSAVAVAAAAAAEPPPPTTITAASAAAAVEPPPTSSPTSSSSSTTTATSKRVQKRRRNHNNKKKEKLLVVVPKGKISSKVTHDPGLPEDTFEVSKVLASSAYNGERMYFLEWKNWRGNDSWVRSSWSDSLEITASFVEDSTIDAVLSALAGQPVAHHLLIKLEKHALFQQLKAKLGTAAVLSTPIAFGTEATEKQRTEAAATLIDFIRKEMEG